jgi:hypothetical protein
MNRTVTAQVLLLAMGYSYIVTAINAAQHPPIPDLGSH